MRIQEKLLFLLLLFFSCGVFGLSQDDKKIYDSLKALSLEINHIKFFVQRIGNKTLQLEMAMGIELDQKKIPTILSDFSRYSKWILPNINRKANGDSYIIQIFDLISLPKNQMNIRFQAYFPLILSKKMDLLFLFNSVSEKDLFTLNIEALPSEKSLLSDASGYIKAFLGEPITWFHGSGTIVLKNWLLYEAFPEKVVERDTVDRIQTIIENYLSEEINLEISASPQKKKVKGQR